MAQKQIAHIIPVRLGVNLHDVLPKVVAESLHKGFIEFDKRIKGFIHKDAIIVAPESRTSSPVRIPRDPESLEHPDLRGLYPCGEEEVMQAEYSVQQWMAEGLLLKLRKPS